MEPSTPRHKNRSAAKKYRAKKRWSLNADFGRRNYRRRHKIVLLPTFNMTPNKNPFFYGNSPCPPAPMMTPLQNKENWGLVRRKQSTLVWIMLPI
jgi:hypothetical protein